MDRDLKILVDTSDRLVIESPSEHMGTFYMVLIVVVALGVAYLAYRLWAVSRIASIVTVVICLVVAMLVLADRSTGYRMEMNRPENKLVMTSYSGSDTADPLNSSAVPLSDVDRADMEFNRTSRRITLTMKSSAPIHPLGADFEYLDSQFKALGEIQRFIGQDVTLHTPAH